MNRHHLVIIGLALLGLFFSVWMIRRSARKEEERFEREDAARQKAREDRAYRAQRHAAVQTPRDIAEYGRMQRAAMERRNQGAKNSVDRIYPGGQNSAAMETGSPLSLVDSWQPRYEGFSPALAAVYHGNGGTFDGAGASGGWDSPSTDASPSSDSGSSGSSDSGSSSSSD